MSSVVLEALVKKYDFLQVVHSINLEIAPQEFVVLVGPSGCGKSTTLRMIAGLEEISGGKISIDGRVVNRVAPKDRDVAMVFQNYALYPHLNVAENIAFGLKIRKTPDAEVKRLTTEVAATLGLTEYLERRPSDLSGGQRQRVAMGRAVVRHPKVFLFDEPLSNLDAKLRTQMRAEIKRLHRRLGATSVYVTHDQTEAMTLADRIVVMNDGHIEQVGNPMEVFLNPISTFVASFIGSPPMNQLEATLETNDNGFVARYADQMIPLPDEPELKERVGGKIIVGIRPEYADVRKDFGNRIDVQLDLVETLGSEALLHTSFGETPFVIKTETDGDLDFLNSVTSFSVNPAKIKVFDFETGLALGYKVGGGSSGK